MKKQVKIIGKEIKKGISKKSNEPFVLHILYGTYENKDIEGCGAWNGVIPEVYFDRVQIGDSVELETIFVNGKELIVSFLLSSWQ